jgi:hypothetical protein
MASITLAGLPQHLQDGFGTFHTHLFGRTSVHSPSTRRSRRSGATRGVVTASTALSLCRMAACGSDDGESSGNGSASGGQADDAAVSAAQERLDPYLEPVDDIEVGTPLTKKPEAGLSIYSIRYNLPVAAEWDKPFTETGKALGWTLTTSRSTGPSAVDGQRHAPRRW